MKTSKFVMPKQVEYAVSDKEEILNNEINAKKRVCCLSETTKTTKPDT